MPGTRIVVTCHKRKGADMSVSIRIDDEIYDEAKKIAKAEFRSPPQQIEFWARVGKCALDNPGLPIEFVRDLLISKNYGQVACRAFRVRGY